MAKIKNLLDDKNNSEPSVPPTNAVTDKKFSSTIRIPCEQYAFIEVTVHDTPEEIIETYRTMTKLYQGGTGITEPEFQKALDRYITENVMEAEVYVAMNREQQNIIQNLKRAFKRINKRLED